MSEPAEDPRTPFLDHHRAVPRTGYRRLIGAHRASGLGGPSRGYLFTVALLAGTASMPILAAISAGSATVGNSALPDGSSTPFIPTPSVGPVVIQLPVGTQPPVLPSRAPATGVPRPVSALVPAAPALPDDRDLGARRRSRPAVPTPTPGPTRTTPTGSPCPSRVPSPSPSAFEPAVPDPTPSPTAEPTSTLTGPAIDPPTTAAPEPTATGPDGSPPPPSAPPEESPTPAPSPTAAPDPSPTTARTGVPRR
ncbi:hypothetical protein [Micromonospora sp. SL4-19]|uniref:hypothetical protein n=1 Tax=Micromonospora sp. SL4-19 TaxID=3399129 RepID=UPI003A4DD2CC